MSKEQLERALALDAADQRGRIDRQERRDVEVNIR
jgi:hypothetical protein